MALQQRKVLGKVTINHKTGGHCEVQEIIEIFDDASGVIVSEKFHRIVVEPGDDAKSNECGVKYITDVAWTPKIRQAHKDKKDTKPIKGNKIKNSK